MTFPSNGPGYPQQGGAQGPGTPGPESGQFAQAGPLPQQQQQSGSAGIILSIPVVLALATTLFGLVSYFIGFGEDAAYFDQAAPFVLIGGLLAALRMLPRAPRVLPFAALASVLGALWELQLVVRAPAEAEVPGVITVLLILSILQMVIAVAALLFDHGVLKVPAPRPQAQYGQQQYGQPAPGGQFGPESGRLPQQGPGSGGFAQPTQVAHPVNPAQPPATPSQQPTTYAPQQGQFYQRPAGEGGQQQQQQPPPGTPPGGFDQPG